MKADIEAKLDVWKRFEAAAAAEKDWMNSRLNWMFIPQSVLISAYAVIVNYGPQCEGVSRELLTDLGYVIVGTGLSVSLLVLISVFAAACKHSQWTTRLNKLARQLNSNEHSLLVPFGTPPHWPAMLSRWTPACLAGVFIIAWLSLIGIGLT